MLSDDPIQNSVLYRPNSSSKTTPFLVPIKDSLSSQPMLSNSGLITAKTTAQSSRKSIKILKPDTIKRAHNDACMAAAIGDLDWLKQTLKISSDIGFDKNGFAMIHLASIHGRLNILKYLIEDQKTDIDLASMHGWRPVHLCISSQIGQRAVDCLNYLIEHKADIDAKNNDGVTPLHMSASEGQVECLQILLGLRADTTVKDSRGQTPLDLARLWGHRMCAKLLDTKTWHHDKKELADKEYLLKRNKTKAILQEIERAHLAFYSNKEESEQKFDKWLESIGDRHEPSNNIDENNENNENNNANDGLIEDEHVESKQTLSSNKTSNFQSSQPSFFSSNKTKSSKATVDFVSSSLIRGDLPDSNNQSSKENNENTEKKFKSILKRKETLVNTKAWNFSIKTREFDYVPNLGDFYPRDQFSNLPVNEELLLLNQMLKGMSIEEIKEFMRKKTDNKEMPKPKRGLQRPVHFKPKNIIDAQSKVRNPPGKTPVDFAGLTLCNDVNSFAFKEARKNLVNNDLAFRKQISKSEHKIIDDKLKVVERDFGKEMSEIMRDRHGKMSQRYEKVFIC